MQPFDALTMRAVIQEVGPLLVNRRVDKVYQLGRDEILLAFRLKTGPGHFLLSAQASFGRLCLINAPNLPKHVNPPTFCQLLRKHLTGATVVEIQQLHGERVADLTFSCVDELGTRSIKVLTAEVMGRHSNLIFWDKDNDKIIGASHVVTAEMSRQREVAGGLKYIRPPRQDKPSVFEATKETFDAEFAKLNQSESTEVDNPILTLEQWLLTTFAGMGRHLADEVVAASGATSAINRGAVADSYREALWQRINQMKTINHYKPAMRLDLTRYTVLSWWPELQDAQKAQTDWKQFPSVNDMIEDYFRTLQLREQLQQLKDRIKSELKSETEKLETRLAAATKQLDTTKELNKLKMFGDLILANMHTIEAGQLELSCEDLYRTDTSGGTTAQIALNPNLSPSQNAQHYYRQFAKARVRQQAASIAQSDAAGRMEILRKHMHDLEQAKAPEELARLKEIVLDRGKRQDQQRPLQPAKIHQNQTTQAKAPRIMSTKSSDGWLIYIGRNRNENDALISKLAAPQDIWLHVQGQEGAHVLIKNPNKQDPPGTTLKEAAQLAARFSRISLGSKVRVVYTHCKYVKKAGKDKPGLVRYENEKTIEVDTSAPMPPSLRKLFTR